MARHNKKRNTAFIYESLVREIVKQSVAKDEKKRNVNNDDIIIEIVLFIILKKV